MAAIPTKYRGLQMRSRIEARWAAMFDRVGWPWEYEPIDLDGYIPDFVLMFNRPLLVEVKPDLTIRELYRHVEKLDASGWVDEMLIVGATPDLGDSLTGPAIGLMRGDWGPPGDVRSWGECSWQMCRACNALSIVHAIEGYFCRKCGAWDGDHYLGGVSADAIAAHWTAAANKTMWKAPA